MSLKSSLDAVLGAAVTAGDVPGVVAMIAHRNGPLYEGAFGERVLGGGVPMTVDTVGWIASMTKAITSVAAVQCVERGLLSLDAPAAALLPEIGRAQVFTGFDPSGRPMLRPPKRPVTLRHLLTHTAGFSYEMWNPDVQRLQQALGIPGISARTRKALEMPLLFDPGERWEYGIGIDWAGRMIEAASGLTLGAFLADNVLGPLGMESTAFRITTDMRARLAGVHVRGADGRLAPVPYALPAEPDFEMGGGGLYGTMGDYLRFTRMILNGGQLGGERVLRPESVASLGVNHMGDCRVKLLKSATARTNDAEFFPGVPKTWSLAFQVNEAPAPTGRPAGGLMWAGLANSYYWIDPVNGLAGVFMTQIFPFADTRALPLFHDVERAVYNHLGGNPA